MKSRRAERLGLLLTILLDVAFINLALLLAYYIRYELQWFKQVDPAFDTTYRAYLPFAAGLTALSLIAFWVDGVYTPRRGQTWFDEVYRLGNGATTAIFLLVVVTFGTRPLAFSRLLFFYAGVLEVVLLGGWRLARREVQAELRRRGRNVVRVLIVGAGDLGRAVMRQIVARPDLGYQIVGFVSDGQPGEAATIGRIKRLGGLDDIEALLDEQRVDQVIITLAWQYQSRIRGLVRLCERRGVPARVVPDFFQLSLSRVDVDDLGGIPLIGVKEPSIPRAGRLVKRALDLALTGLGLLLLLPLFLLVALAIKLESRGPALFAQTRIGQHGRPFRFFKFRSMKMGAEEEQPALADLNEATGPLFKIKDDPRLTRFGRLLRRASLDELPQFINVLKGEMSLVGPRPGLPQEVEQYQPWQRQRLEVPPGITGLWQVSGRSDLTFDEMCLLDVYYIENWSLGLDVTILLRTIPRVIFGNGAY